MSIDEYIQRFYSCNTTAEYLESGKLLKFMSSLCKDENLGFRNIYSNMFYPKIITINDESTIVWDSSYWYCYSKFLEGVFILNKALKHNNTAKVELGKNIVKASFYYFLSIMTRKQDPYFAAICSKRYRSNIGITENDSIEKAEFLRIATVYCIIHEIIHAIYKHDEEREERELINLNDSLEKIKVVINTFLEEMYNKYYPCSKKEFIHAISECMGNKPMKEEIMCDTYAFNHCLQLFGVILGTKYTQEQILYKCMESISILHMFNQWTILVNDMKNYYYSSTKDDMSKSELEKQFCEINKKTLDRFYINEIITALQLYAQGNLLSFGKDYYILTQLDNTSILENIIEKEFLDYGFLDIYSRTDDVINLSKDEVNNVINRNLNWNI